MTQQPVTPRTPRAVYRPLGWLRLGLAAMVAFYHAPVGLLPDWAARCGPVAVFVFFALSGFIISEAADAFYRARPWAFIANRFVRLYPPYLIVLLVAAVSWAAADVAQQLPGHTFDWRNLLVNTAAALPLATPAQRLLGLPERYEFISVIWAVRVEFAFYFAVFAVLLLTASGPRPLRRAIVATAIAGSLLLHVVSFYLSPLGGGLAPLVSYTPFFVLGVAAYGLETARDRGARWFLGTALAVALPLSLLRAMVYPLDDVATGFGQAWAGLDPTVAIGAAAMLVVLLGLAAVLSRRHVRGAARAGDRAAGNLSYPVYITHTVPLGLVALFGGEAGWLFVLALLATVPAAWLLDRISQALLDPLRNRLRRAPVPG